MNLTDAQDKKIGALSGGMRQRVGIVQAMLSDPKILIQNAHKGVDERGFPGPVFTQQAIHTLTQGGGKVFQRILALVLFRIYLLDGAKTALVVLGGSISEVDTLVSTFTFGE